MSSWWHHWMWGVALPAFALAYMARCVRRSGVMTAAEWMITRFGTGPGGRAARYATALTAVVFTAMVGVLLLLNLAKCVFRSFAPMPAGYRSVEHSWWAPDEAKTAP